MIQSAKSPIQPAREHIDEEKKAFRATAPVPGPSLEDHCLTERVERALRATGYGALHTVRVSVDARVIILQGRVSSYYMKQIAQATALAIPGAHQIRNGLDVVRPNSDGHKACEMRQRKSKTSDPPDDQRGKD
jgi:hypothetical protein